MTLHIKEQPGFRLIDGADVNAIVEEVNGLEDGSVPGAFKGTFQGGLIATGASIFSTVPIGSVAYNAFGNDTTPVAGTLYIAEVDVPRNFTATGIAVLNGATVGTDKGLVGLFNSAGSPLASSSAAGATTAGANAFQARNFTSPVALTGPGRYFIAYQSNGTTDTLRTIAASTFVACLTRSLTGTFGNIGGMSPPTSFAPNVGPIAYLF